MQKPTQISHAKYMQALALFTVAKSHYIKAHDMETELSDLLGFDESGYCGHISDEMIQGGGFDVGLKKANFVVVKPKRRAKAKK